MHSADAANGRLPIGRRIEAWRKTAGMNRQELAAIIDGSSHRLANIETGRSPVHAEEVKSIADALHVPAAWILEETPPMA